MLKKVFNYAAVIFCLLMIFSSFSFADLNIVVKYDKNWGGARTSNIRKLCENVALHFQENLRDENKINGKLTIVYRAAGPVAYYRKFFGGGPDEYQIGLNVTGPYWAGFSYQFGHEFTHVLHRHDKFNNGRENKNAWFHEALCEVASLWVIYEMGETWAYRAPYAIWVDWRHNLTNFANYLKNRAGVPYNKSGAQWLREWEDKIRDEGAFTYERGAQLSYKFLPIFQEDPEAWNAVAQLPITNSKMSEYMEEWYDYVDPQDQKHVKKIAEVMGITINDNAIIAAIDINFDVNNDGYVNLSDVLIVKSGIQKSVGYDTDVNDDGRTDEVDVLLVKAKAIEAIVLAAPKKHRVKLTTLGALKRK